VQVPKVAYEFKNKQNEARKKTLDTRLIPITLVVEAIIEAGLKAGGWEEIAIQKAAEFKAITKRGRQPKKK
jgi:hypothetical protein